MSRTFTISDLAREFAITPRAIRHYEDEGLLAPAREGQKRIYSARDRVRLALLLRGRRLGFTLAEAKEIIDLYSAPQGEAAQLELLLDRLAGKRALLEEKRRDVDAAISDMDRYAERCRARLAELRAGREAAE